MDVSTAENIQLLIGSAESERTKHTVTVLQQRSSSATMDDGDQGGSTTAIHSDPRFIVATTLATLVVAGSTYIWRSNPRRLLGLSDQPGKSLHKIYHHTGIANSQSIGEDTSTSRQVSVPDPAGGVMLVVNDDLGNHADGKDPKSSRSKERRRRGKDPLRELLKGGKKSKVLTKSIKLAEVDGNGVASSDTLPAIQESTRSRHSRERSLTASSRSVSTASTSNRRTPPPPSDWAGPSPNSKQGTHESDDADARAFSTSNISNSLSETSSQNQTVPDSHPSDHSLQPDHLTHPQSPDLPNSCISTSSSTSHSSSMFSSDLGVTSNTSTSSLSDKTPTLEAESSLYSSPRTPANTITTSTTLPSVQKDTTWGTVPSSSTSDNSLRKPPRFRSKSRGSKPSPVSPTTPAFNVMSTSDSEPKALPSSVSAGPRDDSHPLMFPTLNSSSGPPSNVSNRTANHVTSNGNGTGVSSKESGHLNGTTPKRAPTPRRPPTPLSGTNTPGSLSAQTQLASLRGALEAARLREEKTKAEIERYSKDLEMMRWESTSWRRREMDVGSLSFQRSISLTIMSAASKSDPPLNASGPGLRNAGHFDVRPTATSCSAPPFQ
jgi:anthranilate synthase / indole-3-glycerol phosphate synthase / phosphoribosylanthranilate isomerase